MFTVEVLNDEPPVEEVDHVPFTIFTILYALTLQNTATFSQE